MADFIHGGGMQSVLDILQNPLRERFVRNYIIKINKLIDRL